MGEFIDKIVAQLDNPLWWVSQIFAFIALVCFLWGWQIKNKMRMMTLIGIASAALAASASFLGNFSLGVLFGLAAVRNFVFAYLELRVSKGKHVAKWLTYMFAGIFAFCTITATILLVHVIKVDIHSIWLEWFICATLLGLILGNILKGTNVMRVSFILNRAFNIINHIYFVNLISVIIAALAIGSNFVYYIRLFVAWIRQRNKEKKTGEVAETKTEEIEKAEQAEETT